MFWVNAASEFCLWRGVFSRSGAEYCEEFVFSVFLGDDIIPRLSLSSAFDLKIRLLTELHHCDIPKVLARYRPL